MMNWNRQRKLVWMAVTAALMWANSANIEFAGTVIKQEKMAADCTHPEASQQTSTVAPAILKPEEIARMSPALRAEFLQVLQDGLDAWRQWADVSATNIANIDTTRTAEGTPYRRKAVVFQIVRLCKPGPSVVLLEAVRVVDAAGPFDMRYEPGHPDAREDGYVRYPNVFVDREMANLMAAARGYIASIEAIRAIQANARNSSAVLH